MLQDYKSSVGVLGETTKQIIGFTDGTIRTIANINTKKIMQTNGHTILPSSNGIAFQIRDSNVCWIVVEGDRKEEPASSFSAIFHFKNDVKKTVQGLVDGQEKIGQFWKFDLATGEMLLVNPRNLNMLETLPSDSNKLIVSAE